MATGGSKNTTQNKKGPLIPENQQKDLAKLATSNEKMIKSVDQLGGNLKRGKETIGDIGGTIGRGISEIREKTSANAGMFGDKSIIGKASKNVFEFPVFMSSSVPIDFATATNSLLEQIYASYLQMAVSQTPIVSAADAKSGNIFNNMKSDVTKYLEYTDMFYAHDACHNIIETEDAVFEYHMINVPDDMNKVIMEQLDYRPLSEFDHFFQEADDSDDFDTKEVNRLLKEVQDLEEEQDKLLDNKKAGVADQKELERLEDIKKELKDARVALNSARNMSNGEFEMADKFKFDSEGRTRNDREEARSAEKHKDDIGRKTEKDQNGNDKLDENGNPVTTTRKERQEARDMAAAKLDARQKDISMRKDVRSKAPQILDETKIQKLNTMKPLMMTVGVKVMSENGNYVSDLIEYVVGVKTHCRVVPADVLPDVAEYPNKGQNILSRKARWRAGEIKFLDYLFSRKDKKQAAYDSKDPNRKWYHRLYTLAHSKGSSKVAKKITGKRSEEGLIPNATLVMTKSDVDMIEATNGIDLLKGSTAKNLCVEMFLIAMVVIDTDAQSIKILLPDVNNDYEVHSLASVNKQLATLDTSNAVSREVTKMMHGR